MTESLLLKKDNVVNADLQNNLEVYLFDELFQEIVTKQSNLTRLFYHQNPYKIMV